jgi:photosystem II stability/assembly factor-like uncharacterized protein
VAVDSHGVITAVGEFGLILRTVDAGKTWQTLHKGDASLFALQLRADGVGYAVGQDGAVLRTADGGSTWTPMTVNSSSILLGVNSGTDGRVVVTGIHDMLVSDDDGKSWRHVIDPEVATSWYQGIARAETASPVFAVGHGGQIIRVGK